MATTRAQPLEVAVVGVSDVDRAKAFYEQLGWRLCGAMRSFVDLASARWLERKTERL